MDLLFKRYANPFLLMDNMIATGRFYEFVMEFIDIHNDEKIYAVWLHKIFDKGFDAFKEAVMENNQIVNVDNQNVGTTINESMNILNNFNPHES